MSDGSLDTASALLLTKIGRRQWDNIMMRQLFAHAPAVMAGRPRYFDRDDLIALLVLDHCIRAKVEMKMAGEIASFVLIELFRRPQLESLSILIDATDSYARVRLATHEDFISLKIPVEYLRRTADKAISKNSDVRQS